LACPPGALAAVGLDPTAPARDQGDDKQNQEDEKQYFRNSRCRAYQTRESEYRGYDSHDQKNYRPI
jgi:hypothetical protein